MIFLTVGTQLPFERLIKCVDDFAQLNPDLKLVGQIGESSYLPKHFEYVEHMSIQEFDDHFEKSDVVIAHAGMGTIINALCSGKQLFLMPRLVAHGEHRNNHQVGTAEKFSQYENCAVFSTLDELSQKFKVSKPNSQSSNLSRYAPESVTNKLAKILGEE